MIPKDIRVSDYYSHIDMGFLNRRLAITALGPLREAFLERQRPGQDHMTVLNNDHLLVTMLIDVCSEIKVPTLAEALNTVKPRQLFMSTERVEACSEIYEAARVSHNFHFDAAIEKPVHLIYHTKHIVSDTGKMTLAEGYKRGYRQSIIGLLHLRSTIWEVEPIVIGAPWLDHPRNKDGQNAVWYSNEYGELLPEDIKEFAKLSEVSVTDENEWMSVMQKTPENKVKEAFAKLLKEPTKPDWGGEENDHFSGNVTVDARRRTCAFLLKGPSKFTEMTPAMCGKNGDQIYRLSNCGADISVVQHSHLIGPAVRETVRNFITRPGRPRKFCIIDGQSTYRILKAYGFLES